MTKICGRCGTEYEGYMFLVEDNLSAIVKNEKIKNVYEQVCEDCRSEITREELRNNDGKTKSC